MKFILLSIISFTFCVSAQANELSCFGGVEAVLMQEIEANGWSFHGVDGLSKDVITNMLTHLDDWANELDEDEVSEIMDMYVSQGQYEYYHVTGTGDYSGGYQELIIVDPNNQCSQVARYLTYAE